MTATDLAVLITVTSRVRRCGCDHTHRKLKAAWLCTNREKNVLDLVVTNGILLVTEFIKNTVKGSHQAIGDLSLIILEIIPTTHTSEELRFDFSRIR